ncbi:MAG: hypothetical protein HKM05_11920, partial [Spirochaetales bacterium]|nr:hypothetical protein [Spirochaetales bacterium]
MSDELENKKPKATLIKHSKPEVTPPVDLEAEKKKTVVVVKKKTVVKKKVVVHKEESAGSQAAAPSSPASGAANSAKPEGSSRPAGKAEPVEGRLSAEKIAEFMSKRPQEMRRFDPSE